MKQRNTLRALVALVLIMIAISVPVFAQDKTDTIPAGQKVTFTAEADGYPAPTFEWFKDGAKIGEGPTLTIDTFANANVGAYTVKATNSSGSATSDKYVLGLGVPPSKPTIKIVVEINVTVGVNTSNPSK